MTSSIISEPAAGGGEAGDQTQASSRRRRFRLLRRSNPAHAPRRGRARVALVLAAPVAVAAGLTAGIRLGPPPPPATLEATLPVRSVVPGNPPALSWPASGQAAVAIPSIGALARSGAEQPVPVASLTKLMTALVVLEDHPLRAGDGGPQITVTLVDAADLQNDETTGQTLVALAPGEVLTERQALLGLIVHSANDLADLLARWDAGSEEAFVRRMNATAARLGLRHTHYVDASGFDTGSVSTAADQLTVAAADMAIPAFARIAATPSVDLPVAGTVDSYTPMLGVDGVVGVKSGFTSAAGGCDVLALFRRIGGRPVLVLAAVTGQQAVPGGPSVLAVAGLVGKQLATEAAAAVSVVPVAHPGRSVVRVASGSTGARGVLAGAATLLAWPGQVVRQALVDLRPPAPGARPGAVIARARFAAGPQRVSVAVRLTRALPAPSLVHRLF